MGAGSDPSLKQSAVEEIHCRHLNKSYNVSSVLQIKCLPSWKRPEVHRNELEMGCLRFSTGGESNTSALHESSRKTA